MKTTREEHDAIAASTRSFNDDDIYIYDIQSRRVVESYGSSSPTARAARFGGIPVKAGQSWCKGMQAKYMELT